MKFGRRAMGGVAGLQLGRVLIAGSIVREWRVCAATLERSTGIILWLGPFIFGAGVSS